MDLVLAVGYPDDLVRIWPRPHPDHANAVLAHVRRSHVFREYFALAIGAKNPHQQLYWLSRLAAFSQGLRLRMVLENRALRAENLRDYDNQRLGIAALSRRKWENRCKHLQK